MTALSPSPAAHLLAIERLYYEYVWSADGADGPDLAALVECFTPGATWEAPDFGKYCTGRDEIAAHFSVSPYLQPKHHFITNVRVDLSANLMGATSTAYLMMYSRLPVPTGGAPRLVTRTSRYST